MSCSKLSRMPLLLVFGCVIPSSTASAVNDRVDSQEAGIDVRTADIGATIEEVMTSYEVTVPGVNRGMPMQGPFYAFCCRFTTEQERSGQSNPVGT